MMTILNTCFQHHPRRLYTWKSPGDRYRNQIDYIMIKSRWRSSISNVKTFPGADCGSDHCLLIANFALRLKSLKKGCCIRPRRLEAVEGRAFGNGISAALTEQPLSAGACVNDQWNRLKEIMLKTIDAISKQRSLPNRRQAWLSTVTWNKIQERKTLKMSGLTTPMERDAYSELSRIIQLECRRDKNIFIENICREIEDHALKTQTSDLFKKVKFLSKQSKPRTWVVEDENGIRLQDLEAVAERWRKYCEDLYKNSHAQSLLQNGSSSWDQMDLEPPILLNEVTTAIKALKDKKAPGPDQITAELIKAMGSPGASAIHKICDNIWRTGEWPNDWSTSVILPLHKKGSTAKCDNYRTLALISHASKVLLHIINKRIRHFLDWQIPQEQAGFVKGKGTREQILNVRHIIEKSYEFNTPVILCFIDYSKAFDCVIWSALWIVLEELGVPKHLVALIQSLYQSNQGMVKVETTTSKAFKFGKGVRQGCILSPILFNVYGEYIIRRTLENWEGGVTIGGTRITNLRYADDTALLAADEAEMIVLLSKIEAISLELGLKINHSKTKLMVVDRNKSLQMTGALTLEKVDDFVYLGASISNTGSCEKEIRRRIGMAKNAMSQLYRIWKDRNISRRTKMRLVYSLVFPVFAYSSETWTLKKADRDRIDAFEMWCWRKMLRIPWTAFRTNQSILRELKIKDRLSTTCLRRVLEFFGHIARKEGHNLEQLMVTGKVDGKRPRGRSPTRWSDQVRTVLNSTLHGALHIAKDRSRWRAVVKEKLSLHRGDHDPQ